MHSESGSDIIYIAKGCDFVLQWQNKFAAGTQQDVFFVFCWRVYV